MLPYFVLGGFAGLRRCEIARVERDREALRWSDLYFDAGNPNIEIRTIATKKTARQSDLHYVDADYAIEAVQAWLPLCDCKSPFVFRWTTRQWQELKRRFKKATGIKFIKNGFRNSFATFALSYNGLNGLGQVAKQMGDLEGTVRHHYVRNLPAGSGRAWFNLRPFEVVSSPTAVMA
jgi:integrase